MAQETDFVGHAIRADRYRHALQSAWKTDEQLEAIGEQNRIDDRCRWGHLFEARNPGVGRIHAFVAEIIAQFIDFQEFDSVACFAQDRFHARRRPGGGPLKQEIGQLVVEPSHGLSKWNRRRTGGGQQLRAHRAQHERGPAVGLDRLIRLPELHEELAGLPMPPIQRFRRHGLLSGQDGAARQVQRFLVPLFGFVESSEISPGVRCRAVIVDGLTGVGCPLIGGKGRLHQLGMLER